tara:strand:- start:6864 stop:7121 length:258 start_codon:yes stop_codon:yes gene_type:complete
LDPQDSDWTYEIAATGQDHAANLQLSVFLSSGAIAEPAENPRPAVGDILTGEVFTGEVFTGEVFRDGVSRWHFRWHFWWHFRLAF